MSLGEYIRGREFDVRTTTAVAVFRGQTITNHYSLAHKMTHRIYHTHPNPKQGRNEPLLVETEGWDCPECRKPGPPAALPTKKAKTEHNYDMQCTTSSAR